MIFAAGAGFAGDGWLPITLIIGAIVVVGAMTIYFKNVRPNRNSKPDKGGAK